MNIKDKKKVRIVGIMNQNHTLSFLKFQQHKLAQ